MEGESPEIVETSTIQSRIKAIGKRCSLTPDSTRRIAFDPAKDLVYHYFESLPQHPNGMRICVFDERDDLLATNEYFSIGGFVINERTQLAHGDNAFYMEDTSKTAPATPEVEIILVKAEKLADEIIGSGNEPSIKTFTEKLNAVKAGVVAAATTKPKVIPQTRKNQDLAATAALPFKSATELMELCRREDTTIAQVVYENELRWRSAAEIRARTLAIWETMDLAIKIDVCRQKKCCSITPLFKDSVGIDSHGCVERHKPSPEIEQVLPKRTVKRLMLPALDYLSVYAIAVNEENAAGGLVVTAPTSGAEGVIPAVLKYYLEFISDTPEQDIIEFLLTTAAVGMLYKRGASISAAEMGCQGEVGVACSMASAGFAAVMGGTGMEHNRKASADAALHVTLDQVIETMRQTGNDMQAKYKETSQGGLSGNSDTHLTLHIPAVSAPLPTAYSSMFIVCVPVCKSVSRELVNCSGADLI